MKKNTMKNPGARSWVSSLERKFIIPRDTYSDPKTQKPTLDITNFPEQAPGYVPLFPITAWNLAGTLHETGPQKYGQGSCFMKYTSYFA
jgi:hypothetical protein